MAATVPIAPRSLEPTVPPLLRTARTIGVALALLLAAYLAMTSSPTEPATRASTSDAAGLAVATGDLVNRVAAVDDVSRVTGGYVPNVGVVLTTQVEQLSSADIDGWVADQLAGQQALIDLLDPAEDVIQYMNNGKPCDHPNVAARAADAGSAWAAGQAFKASAGESLNFDDFADWYTSKGYSSIPWLELLDLRKWVVME